jgi:hypothetical protein
MVETQPVGRLQLKKKDDDSLTPLPLFYRAALLNR